MALRLDLIYGLTQGLSERKRCLLFLQQFSGGLTSAPIARREARQGGSRRAGEEREEGEEGATDEMDHERKPYSLVDYRWGTGDGVRCSSLVPTTSPLQNEES